MVFPRNFSFIFSVLFWGEKDVNESGEDLIPRDDVFFYFLSSPPRKPRWWQLKYFWNFHPAKLRKNLI